MATFASVFILFLLVLVHIPANAADVFANLRVRVLKNPAPGYYYMSQASSDSLGLMDHAGQFTQRYASDVALTFYPTGTNETIEYVGVAKNYIVRNNKQQVLRTLTTVGEFSPDFHEGTKLSNGNYLLLTYEIKTMDLSAIATGGNPTASVMGAVLQEVTPTGSLVWSWNSLDYIPVSHATSDVDLSQQVVDYIHVNSVAEEPDGTFLVSGRHTDAIYKISRTTKNIVWTLGGVNAKVNDFTYLNDNIGGKYGFSHQHSISRRSNGNLIMFDNGNLRDNPYSRMVEYELNESSKTIKSVRVLRHSPDVYSSSMGSVQELPNGTFLVGWGNNESGIIATEFAGNGDVLVEIDNPTPAVISSYRVSKSTMSLNYGIKNVSAASTFTITNGDSTTNVGYVLSAVNRTTAITVEKHYYSPHAITYRTNTTRACIELPIRWTLRCSDAAALAGSTTFDLKNMSQVLYPELVRFYKRDTEGEGDFTQLASTYNASTGLATINQVITGEVFIGYEGCAKPTITSPAMAATEVSTSPVIMWTPSLQHDGYEIQLSTNSTFDQDLKAFFSAQPEQLIQNLSYGVKYFVRARGISGNTQHPWSPTSTFRTAIGTPQAVRPLGVNDTARVGSAVTFEWTTAQGAVYYNLVVKERSTGVVFLDTLVTTTTVKRTMPLARLYNWEVRGVVDTVKGRASAPVIFYVIPDKAELQFPANLATNVSYENAQLVWKRMPDITAYDLEVRLLPDTAVWHSAVVPGTSYILPELPPNRSFTWKVRARGKYGAGPYSEVFTATTAGPATIGTPACVSPLEGTITDTSNVTFVWHKISSATGYHLQIASGTFNSPTFEKYEIKDTTFTVPDLPSGVVLRWRVRATAYDRTSLWSTAPQFSTISKAPDFLEPLNPKSGSTNVPLSGQFVFTGDSRYSTYEVHLATSSFFDNAVVLLAGNNTSVAYSDLQPNTQYYWRAFGRTNAAVSDSGEIAWFATQTSTSVNNPEAVSSAQVRHTQDLLVIQAREIGFTPQTTVVARDMKGATVQLQPIANSETQLVFSTRGLASGVYVVTVDTHSSAPLVFTFIQLQ